MGGGTVSDGITRDYSFTVRLSPEERAYLEQLAQHFDLDKSATVRRALQLTLASSKTALTETGLFVPLRAEELAFPVRLSGKDADER
jgi:hypothetical protein